MELNKNITKPKESLLEDINLNINDILSFTFNIDNLKKFLTTLLKNQNLLSKKILELENKLKLKDSFNPYKTTRNKFAKSVRGVNFDVNNVKKYNEKDSKKIEKKNLENKPNDNENIDGKNNEENKFGNDKLKEIPITIFEENKKGEINKDNKNDNINSQNENKNINENDMNDNNIDNNDNNENYEEDDELYSDKDNEENIERDENEQNEKNKENLIKNQKIQNNNINNEIQVEKESEFVLSNYEIFEIKNKIKNIQKKIKNLELLNKVNKFTSNIDDKSEDIQMLRVTLKDVKSDNKNLKKENEDLKKKIENINVKLTDLNIFDLFKDCQLEDGTIDAAKALVISLEQKFLKKTALMDERDKKMFSDILDLKTRDQNVVNKNGVIEHNINEVRNNFKHLGELVTKANNDNNSAMNNIEKKMNNLYKDLFDKYDEKNTKIESNILKINDKILNLEKFKNENMNNINNINNTNNLELNEETLKFLSSQNIRINDIENRINSILELAELTPTKEDIEKLEKEISKKSNSQDYYDLKEKYNLQLAKTNSLEEHIESLQDLFEKKNSEMIFYTKKIENLTSKVVSLRAQMEDFINKEENKILDLTRYLEKVTFNKHLITEQNENKKIDNNCEK